VVCMSQKLNLESEPGTSILFMLRSKTVTNQHDGRFINHSGRQLREIPLTYTWRASSMARKIDTPFAYKLEGVLEAII